MAARAPNEGLGAVLLKRFDQALIDGDQVLAIIDASAINNDGTTMGLTTPNATMQRALIRRALQSASIPPDSIGYYEAHGTGTPLGDPIEIKSAAEVYREFTDECGYCVLGSVKSNIGHLLSAAGIAGVIKILLGLQHQTRPATLHCQDPHPRFKLDDSPFRLAHVTQPWLPRRGMRRAAISSFGFGGTNVHMVLRGFDGAQYGHRVTRHPLPITPMNRQRYWIEEPSRATKADPETEVLRLLRSVSEGQMSTESAVEILQSTGLIDITSA